MKFEPEGNQHMRLEFARSNTKVTKPKCAMGATGAGLPVGFPFAATGAPSPAAGLAQQAFPGVCGMPSNFLPQLAGCELIFSMFVNIYEAVFRFNC